MPRTGASAAWVWRPRALKSKNGRTRAYHDRIQVCEPVGAVNDQVATMNFLYCHEDAKTGVQRGQAMLRDFYLMNSHLLFTREAYPTAAYPTLGNLAPKAKSKKAAGSPAKGPAQEPDGMCLGDPHKIIGAIKAWESIGIDQINFLMNAAEMIPQEQVLDSLRLFAREVMPAFSETGGRSC